VIKQMVRKVSVSEGNGWQLGRLGSVGRGFCLGHKCRRDGDGAEGY
jgi:hypothetical protein